MLFRYPSAILYGEFNGTVAAIWLHIQVWEKKKTSVYFVSYNAPGIRKPKTETTVYSMKYTRDFIVVILVAFRNRVMYLHVFFNSAHLASERTITVTS